MSKTIGKIISHPIPKVAILTLVLVFIFSHFRTDVAVRASEERVSVFPHSVGSYTNASDSGFDALGTSSLWADIDRTKIVEAMPGASLSDFKVDWSASLSFGNFQALSGVIFEPEDNTETIGGGSSGAGAEDLETESSGDQNNDEQADADQGQESDDVVDGDSGAVVIESGEPIDPVVENTDGQDVSNEDQNISEEENSDSSDVINNSNSSEDQEQGADANIDESAAQDSNEDASTNDSSTSFENSQSPVEDSGSSAAPAESSSPSNDSSSDSSSDSQSASPSSDSSQSSDSGESSSQASGDVSFWDDFRFNTAALFARLYGPGQALAQEIGADDQIVADVVENSDENVTSTADELLGNNVVAETASGDKVVMIEEPYAGLKDSVTFTDFVVDKPLEKNEILNAQLRLSLAAASNFNDDELLIEYSLGNSTSWEEAGRLPLFREASDASNDGYFLYALPVFQSWRDISSLRVRVSYLNPSISTSTDLSAGGVKVLLDSVWLEVDYAVKGDVKGEEEFKDEMGDFGEKSFYDQDELEIGDKTIDFQYSDDNSNETLIIKTDRANYIGLSQTDVYLSVTNSGDEDEKFGLQAYFPNGTGDVVSLESFRRMNEVVSRPLFGNTFYHCSSSWISVSTTTENNSYVCEDDKDERRCLHLEDGGLTCFVENDKIGSTNDVSVSDYWDKNELKNGKLADRRNILKKIFGIGPKKKKVEGSFVAKKSTNEEAYSIKPGETKFFKMRIEFPKGSSGEFYVETIGSNNGYGLLDPWWNASWDYERPINITYSGSALTDYQVSISVDTASLISAGKMQSDCDDIRFADSNRWSVGNELSYYLEPGSCGRANTKIWVKIPSINGNKTIYMYYGNAAAVGASSGSDTFVYFQGFESNNDFNTGSLTVNRKGVAAKNGSYGLSSTVTGGSNRIAVRDGVNSGRNLIWESNVQALSSSTVPLPGIQIAHPNGNNDTSGYTAYLDTRGGIDLGIRKDYDSGQILASYSSYTVSIGQWYFLRFDWRKDGLLSAYLYQNSTSTTALAYCSTTDLSYSDGEYGVAAQDYDYWDNYRIRKMATSSINTSLASEILIANHPPTDPTSLFQYQVNTSTALSNGEWANSQNIYLSATSTDKDGDDATIYYQLVTTSTSFATATSVPGVYCYSGTAFDSCSSKIWSNRGSFLSNWYDPDFLFRSKITILSSKVDSDLNDFPVFIDLARLGSSNSFWQSVRSANGGDLVVTNSVGQRLPLEVVGFSTSTKSGQIYFKADALYDLTDTDFYLYYGSSTASQPASTTEYGSRNVWSGYGGVWHLDYNGTGAQGDWRDSTANSNYSSTTASAPTRVAGPLGYGQQFNGTNNVIRFEKSSSMEPAGDFTLSAWVWWGNQTSAWSKPVHYGQDGIAPYGAYMFQINNADESQTQFQVGKSTWEAITATNFATGTWSYMTGVYDFYSDSILYINGVNRANTSAGINTPTVYDNYGLSFGANGNAAGSWFNGRIDEVRIYPGVRSPEWVSTEYNNQVNVGAFISTSSQETISWYDTEYPYRVKLKANSSQVDADLANFPVYIDLSHLGVNSGFWSHTKKDSSGGDLLITDVRGNRLPLEIVSISTSTKTGEVYFKASSLKDTVNTDFYLYYGSSTATQPASTTAYGARAVWTNGFEAVWHLSSITSIKDSTGNAHNGTYYGNPTNYATGKLGGSIAFDGAGDYIDMGVFGSNTIDFGNSNFTASFWVRPTDTTAGALMSKGTNDTTWSSNEKQFFFTNNAGAAGNGLIPILVGYACDWQSATAGNTVTSGSWNNLVYSRVDSSNTKAIYINNTSVPLTGNYNTSNTADTNTWNLYLGRRISTDVNPNEDFNGDMDEVRLSSSTRSATWLSTEYKNQNAPASFLSTSTEENYTSYVSDSVNITSVPESGNGYKWQAISCDSKNSCSMWVPFNTTVPNFRVDTISPTAPGDLSINRRNETSLVLSFGATTTESNFAEYKIYWKAGSSGVTESDNLLGSSSDASLGNILFDGKATTTINGLSAGTQYVFRIWAYDAYGHGTPSLSELTVTTAGYPRDPEDLAQYRHTSIQIDNGGWSDSSTVNLSASSTADDVYFQLVPIASAFNTTTTTPPIACAYNVSYSDCAGKIWKNSLSWYDNDFLYRAKITTQSSFVNADLTNFPISVDLSVLGSSHSFWNHVKSNGGDIIITNSSGTRLPVEVVSVDTSAKTGEVHFKADLIENSTSTDFYLYYGSSTASQPASSSAYGVYSVWSKPFGAVYHFENGSLKNSASSSWNGVNYGATVGVGVLGDGLTCDGATQYAVITDSAAIRSPFEDNSAGFTVSAWGKQGLGTEAGYMLHKDVTGWRLWQRSTNIQFGVRNNANATWLNLSTTTAQTAGVWYSLAATMNNTQTSQNFYIDNHTALNAVIAARPFDNISNDLTLCANVGGGTNWPGTIDELRVARTERSSTWLSTQYNNLSSPKTFFATSSETIRSSVSVNSIPLSGIPDSSTGYKWQALACNSDGCSDWVGFNASTPNFVVDTTKPTNPGSLTFDSKSPNSITINFGSASTEANFAEYKIFYRADTSGVSESDMLWSSSSDSNLSSRTYSGIGSTTITGLSGNTNYVFNIWAYDLAGNKASGTVELSARTSYLVSNPTDLNQWKGATIMPNGFWTNSSTVGFTATSSGAQGVVSMYYQVIGTTSSFTTSTSTPQSFCNSGTSYAGCASKIWRSGVNWADHSFPYRVKLTAQASQVDGDLTYYPLYFDMSHLGPNNNIWTKMREDGGDLLVANASGTRLPLEVVSVSTSSKTGEIYFRADLVENSTSTDFYLYYGSSTASQPAATATYGSRAVWSNEYVTVWHFNQTSGSLLDSASGNTGAFNGDLPDPRSTRFGYSHHFDGTGDYVQTDSAQLDSTAIANYTVSLWFDADSTVSSMLIWEGDVSQNGWGTGQEMHMSLGYTTNPNYIGMYFGDTEANSVITYNAFTDTTSWHYAAATFSNLNTAPTGSFYLDGGFVASDSGTAVTRGWDTAMRFGRPGTSERYFTGYMDEVRISSTTRSSTWISTEYKNMNNNAAFFSTSSSEFLGASSLAYVTNIPDSADGYRWQTLVCNEDGCSKNWAVFNASTPNFRVDTVAPSVPGSMTVDSKNPTDVTLNLGATSYDANFAEYKIFYKANTAGVTEANSLWGSSSDADLLAMNFNGSASTTVLNLSASTTYYFNIWAYDLAGNSAKAVTETSTTTSGGLFNPTSLAQYRYATSTDLINGDWTNSSTVSFYATSSNSGGETYLYYQVISNGSSFSTATSTPANPCFTNTTYNSCSSKIWKNAEPSWWNTDWKYRRKINFGTNHSLLPAGYTASTTMDTRTGSTNVSLSSGDDVRVVWQLAGGTPTEIDRIGSVWNNASTNIQFRLQTDIATSSNEAALGSYYIYYNNPLAGLPKASSSNVFYEYDDFNNSSIGSEWSLADNDGTAGTTFTETSTLRIHANGSDVWIAPDDYFGAIYRTVPGNFDATLRIIAQGNPNGWAKAGIMVKNNLPLTQSNNGYAIMVVTPSNDFAEQWDSDGDGYLDDYNGAGATAYPDCVRLVKNDGVFQGYYSADCATFTSMPTFQPVGVNHTQNLGIFTSSHANGTLSDVWYDWIKVTLTTSDKEETSLSNEEERGAIDKAIVVKSFPESSTGYKWQAIACNQYACSGWEQFNASTPNFRVDTIKPTAPGNLTLISRRSSSLTLGFGSASTEANFQEYKIFYVQGATIPTEGSILYGSSSEPRLGSRTYSNGTSTVISGLLPNTEYTFNIWAYDQSGQKASATAVTFQTSNTVTETYVYTTGVTSGWIDSPYAWDVVDNTYAYRLVPGNSANDSGNYLLGTANNAPASTKTIFGVELGIEGYTNGPDFVDYKIIPIFSGINWGATSTIDGTNFGSVDGDGTYYVDITDDSNAPVSWTWNDIINLDARVHALNSSTTDITAYVDQIRLRVSVDSYPELAENLSQSLVNGTTTLPANYWSNQDSVVLYAEARDPDTAEMPTVFFQFVPTSTAYITTTTAPVGACISGTAYNSCASKVWLVNYVGAPSDFSATPFIATSSVTGIPDGSYHWQALVCDDDDICSASWVNFSSATSTHLRVDTTPPTAPGWLSYVSNTSGSITVGFGTSTVETNFYRYRIFYTKSSTTAVTEYDSEYSDTNLLAIDFNGASTGTVAGLAKSSDYTFNIWAYDRAGNKASATPMMISSTTAGYVINQTSYLIENDDGASVNLNTSPGLADVPLNNMEKGQRFVARFQIENVGTDQTYNKRYKVQFENNTDAPGVWVDVGGSTAISYSYGLSGANGDALTGRKCAVNGNAWANGLWQEGTNLSNNYNLPLNTYSELAFALQTVNTIAGKTYRLRLIDGTGSSTFDGYTVYPTLTINGSASRKYSKNNPSSLPSNNNDLTYFLDNPGYTAVSVDDSSYDTMTATPAYTIYNFATKHKDHNYAVTANWNGQSSLAPSSNPVYLQVYHFGSTNSWVTVSYNNSAAANTDFTLTGSVGYKMNEYYDTNGYVYWRVYQTTGSATLRTDQYYVSTSTMVSSIGQKHYRWRNDNGYVGQESWYDNDYLYRKEMVLDPDKIPGTASLSNFPVLIAFTDTDLRGTSSGGYVQGSFGWDIIFTNASGTQVKMDHQIEKYDRTTGELVAWVEVPNLYAEKDTQLFIYYGNATTSSSQANNAGTWNSNYKAVWHLDEAGASTTRLDSTSNANNASTEGYDGDEDGSTNIDGTDDFDGTNDHLSVVDANSLDMTGNFTASGWFNPDTTAKPLAFETGGYARYQIAGMYWTSTGGTDITPSGGFSPAAINPYAGALYGQSTWATGGFWKVIDTSLASVYTGTQYTVNFANTDLWNGTADNAESYLVTYIYSPREKQVTFSCGSDDSRVIWINGHQVHFESAAQAMVVDDQSFNYTVKQGWNTFVMFVSNGAADYQAQWRISSTTEGMRYTSNPRILIDKQEYQVSLKAGYLSAFYGTSTVDYSVASTSWQYFTLTGDTSGLNLYLGGSSRASTTFSSGPSANTLPLRIGYLFDGKMDEVRLMSSKATKDWVMANYNSQASIGVGSGKFIKSITPQQTEYNNIATWREAEDTGDPTTGTYITKNNNIRLRLSVANTSGGTASGYRFGLQYASTSINCSTGIGDWHDVPVSATTEHFEMSASSYINNGEPTSQEFSDSEGYYFITGSAVEDPSTSSAQSTLKEDQYTELEWVLNANDNAGEGATYCFRAVDSSGSLLDYYDRYAELTLAGNTNTAPTFTYLPSDGGSATSTPTLNGTNVTFSAMATDAQLNEYYLAVCKTDQIITGNGTAPTCAGGAYCISGLASSSDWASCSYAVSTSTESLDWYAFACDLKWGAGVSKCSTVSQGESPQEASSSPVKVNHRPTYTALSTTVNFRDPGGTFTISATGADTDVDGPDDSMYFYVCRTNSATFGTGCASGQTVCSSTGLTSSNPSCDFVDTAPTPPGANTYYGYVFDSHGAASSPASRSSTYTINNVAPVLGNITLNNGNPITVNIKGAADKQVQIIGASVTDQNGCQSLVSATGVIYLSSVSGGYNCSSNGNNCYPISTANCVVSNCTGADDYVATYTCTANMKFYAIPTDDSTNNPWEADNWLSRLQVYDGSNYSATSSAGVELNTNSALDITENLIDFGSGMGPGDNTGATNQEVTIVNNGNSPLNGDLDGSSLRNAINSYISANNVEWSLTSGFNYSSGNPLSPIPVLVNLALGKPISDTDVTDNIYWGIGLPATTTAGTFEGSTTLSAALDDLDW